MKAKEKKMNIGEVAKKMWEVVQFGGEVADFSADLLAIFTGRPSKKVEGETKVARLKSRIADIGRGDEAIIAKLIAKLEDEDRVVFLRFKVWLAGKDKVKYFILRRHLVFLYEKSEKEALEVILDIISKIEVGGHVMTLEYCDAMEITFDSTIASIQAIGDKVSVAIQPHIRGINKALEKKGAIGKKTNNFKKWAKKFANGG